MFKPENELQNELSLGMDEIKEPGEEKRYELYTSTEIMKLFDENIWEGLRTLEGLRTHGKELDCLLYSLILCSIYIVLHIFNYLF